MRLSRAARSLWAKKPSEIGEPLWLPLTAHMVDSATVAQQVWNRWLSDGVKHAVEAGLSEQGCADRLLVFLAAAHDLGKATPVFQSKPARPPCKEIDEYVEAMITAAGLPMRCYRDFHAAGKTPHALMSQVILEHFGCNSSIAGILDAHHGKPSERLASQQYGLNTYGFNYHLEDMGRAGWTAVWQELIGLALDLSGLASLVDLPTANMAAQVLLSAIVIVVDWIASDQECFPYIRSTDSTSLSDVQRRARTAWKHLALPKPWAASNAWMQSDLYHERFGFHANAVQSTAVQIAKDIHVPGLLVLEAPMGSGKTEAALACAEVFAHKAKRSGVFFALPTQATSNGIFPRMLDWTRSLESFGGHSIRLAHGKAQFNEDYQALRVFPGGADTEYDDNGDIVVHEWFEGRKKALLADFVVGTVDQLLLAALKQKHVMLRHLGLAGKVVVIDECHAYDAYMGQYLARALNWLGAYGVPVILLSATLPADKRRAIVDAYLNTSRPPEELPRSSGYPLITYTDGSEVKDNVISFGGDSRHVSLELLGDDRLADRLGDVLSGGGCAGVIVNTVSRAQDMARMLRGRFGNDTVRLLHSRFLTPDRHRRENECLAELGRPSADRHRPFRRIVVGTQVIEQSLDIDFDVLATDICPMDLLLQRIGRLHRHERQRSPKLEEARCFVLGTKGDGFDSGAEAVYGDYLLMRTKALLPEEIVLPRDISQLVQSTYDDRLAILPESRRYREAKEKHHKTVTDKKSKARVFRLGPIFPRSSQKMAGWLDKDVSTSEKHSEAAVRDTDESIEVLLVYDKDSSGRYYLLGEERGPGIPWNEVPADCVAMQIARQSLCLPRILCAPWMIDKTIDELERINRERLPEWQKSPWLEGELILILDRQYCVTLCGYRLIYDRDYGLLYQKECEEHEGFQLTARKLDSRNEA